MTANYVGPPLLAPLFSTCFIPYFPPEAGYAHSSLFLTTPSPWYSSAVMPPLPYSEGNAISSMKNCHQSSQWVHMKLCQPGIFASTYRCALSGKVVHRSTSPLCNNKRRDVRRHSYTQQYTIHTHNNLWGVLLNNIGAMSVDNW